MRTCLLEKNKETTTISDNPAQITYRKGLLQLVKTPAPVLGPTPVQRARGATVLVVALAMITVRPMSDQTTPRQKRNIHQVEKEAFSPIG